MSMLYIVLSHGDCNLVSLGSFVQLGLAEQRLKSFQAQLVQKSELQGKGAH